VVGPGLIGGAFLKLLIERKNFLAEQLHTRIKIIGLVDINKMVFHEKGIELEKLAG